MEGFNLVRQAAAAFGLAQYHAAFQSDESRSAVERFLHTAEKHSLSIGKASLQDFLGLLALHVSGRRFRVATHYMSETAQFNRGVLAGSR